ncbi:MAG: Ig-like domain-containing protein [Chitinophagaceae bacterium]|nr:Ig-like domain-containing protein [Chitinophagaceae bacterium]
MERNSMQLNLKGKLFLSFMLLFSFVLSQAQADVTRPTVAAVSPANYSISFNAGTSVAALFSEAINAATVNGTTFELRNALTGSLVTATVTYIASTRTARIYPASPLTSLLYTARIKGGTSGVKDLAGNPMSYDYTWTFIMIPLFDLTAPTVLSVSPSNGATGVSTSTTVSVVFSEAMNAATINTTSFELRTAGNTLVPATVSYNSSLRKATLTPSGFLANAAVYKAIVKGGANGVRDAAGNQMNGNYHWSFTTVSAADVTPPTVHSVEPAAGATGVSVNTVVTVKFSEAMNAATINASTFELRNAANVVVPATISYNSAAKKATLTPSSPLAHSAEYKATVKGGASGVKDVAGNAMVNNYAWTFKTMAPSDVTPPAVTSVSPESGDRDVPLNTTVSAVFSEPMNAATVNGTTVQLRDASNTAVTAAVNYDAASRTVRLTPSSALLNGNAYTATITGGSGGVKDLAGNSLAADYIWSFTTIPLTIFEVTDVPDIPVTTDQPIELGVKFNSSVDGYILGIRFYKGDGNDGTHTGHLWNSSGTMLGEAVFVNETASGWQQVLFSSPVAINAGETYVASYFSSLGKYGYTNSYFTDAVVNGPLRALADGEDGGNGVYKYSSSSIFPDETYQSTNYFVDVVFAPGSANGRNYITDTKSPGKTTSAPPVTPPAANTETRTTPPASGPGKQQPDLLLSQSLQVKAMPNPSTGYFNIVISSNNDAAIHLRVTDVSGRGIEARQKLAAGTIQIGHNWTAGIYFVEVIQGGEKKVLRLVKTN